MKIIAISDLHLDASTAGLPRFDDVTKAVNEAVDAAIREKAIAFLFLGDLCDPDNQRSHRCTAFAVETAMRLQAAGIWSRWLVGNHDVIEDGSGTHTLSALKSCEFESRGCFSRVFDSPTLQRTAHFNLVALPFTARSHTYDPEQFIDELEPGFDGYDPNLTTIVIGHLNISGIEIGSETSDMPRGRDVMWPIDACRKKFGSKLLMLGGHYHKRQVFNGIHIVGSPAQLSFSEEGQDKGYLMIEVGNE